MLQHHFLSNNKDIVDMDTNERIRYVSESSMSGTTTSGYSTTSSCAGNSPSSTGYSPAHSPASALPAEFSNLTLPQNNQLIQHSPPQYLQLQPSVPLSQPAYNNIEMMDVHYNFGNFQTQQISGRPVNFQSCNNNSYMAAKTDYLAKLRISEQPVEKFRFRYKSEMHGTHGSLNGANSHRNTKSFPEVELSGHDGPAIIRCSLFQTNRNSPHSHQLVVRKDDHDTCDPHELKVSKELGYFAEFKNMGIIHTAKKFIVEELLKKKQKRLQFELGRDQLTTKEQQELYKQTEKEAKDMNLNQVRLCFEAFRVDDNNLYTPIAAPVFSNPINNRKSAQTGELRITRLSIATGSVSGREDLILLVEKVSKKNIKVRFFEMNEDELVWEAFASFRESDVHHQYAIVCQTPAYKDKDVDKSVEVFIELVRPSDDERSYPPVAFRYKPREAIISRKRRRTCSSASGSSGTNSGSLSSGEIPKTIQEQQQSGVFSKTLSEEIERLLNSPDLRQKCKEFSEKDIYNSFEDLLCMFNSGENETDGTGSTNSFDNQNIHYKKVMISNASQTSSNYMQRIIKIYLNTKLKSSTPPDLAQTAEEITKVFEEHYNKNGESLIHEVVTNDNSKLAIELCQIIKMFKLGPKFNEMLNSKGQSALHLACLYDRPQYIRPLLGLGCNPNIQDMKGDTALHIAVREGNLKCLESFLKSEQNLQLHIRNDDGFTPLHLAIRNNKCAMATKLIMHDKTIAAVPNSVDGSNALHIVIQQQCLELVKLILGNQTSGTLLHASNTAGNTPLDVARQLAPCSPEAAEIFNILQKYNSSLKPSPYDTVPFSDLEDNCSTLMIKEEEQSSESDDEGDDDSQEPMVTIPAQTKDVKYDMDTYIKTEPKEQYFGASELAIALEDPNIFARLCEALKSNDLWKQKLKIPQFYLKDVELMLNYIKRNMDDNICNSFALILEEIDNKLIELIKK